MIYLLTFIEYRYSLLATFAPLLEPAIPKLIVRLRCACQKFYLFSSASVWAIIGVVYRSLEGCFGIRIEEELNVIAIFAYVKQ